MALKVLLPTALRHLVGNQDAVLLSGKTVAEVMNDLVNKFPELRKHLFNNEGKLRNFVNVYVNDEDVRYMQEENTPVKEGDTVSIVPSIAGGSIAAIEGTFAGIELDNDEIARYSRHLIMPEVGMEGQKKLKAAKVLLISAICSDRSFTAPMMSADPSCCRRKTRSWRSIRTSRLIPTKQCSSLTMLLISFDPTIL